jgi:hypothetical protein
MRSFLPINKIFSLVKKAILKLKIEILLSHGPRGRINYTTD